VVLVADLAVWAVDLAVLAVDLAAWEDWVEASAAWAVDLEV